MTCVIHLVFCEFPPSFRLTLNLSTRHTSAYVTHNNGLRVVEASMKEFCIARHLYKTHDVAATYNIGRVIAQHCKEMGLYGVMWQHEHKKAQRPMKVSPFQQANFVYVCWLS